MRIKAEHIILAIIFIATLSFRLYFSLETSTFNSDQAYFHLRHINSIANDKQIITYDPLSYSGRTALYPPLLHILMALLSFGNIILLKIINEVAISSLVIIVYIIAKELSNNNYSALFSSLLSAFIPGMMRETLNEITAYALALPLLFLVLYLFTKLENRKILWMFTIIIFLLSLTSSIVFIFLLSLVFYFLLTSGGALNPSRIEKEATLFSTLLIFLLSLIIYKKAFFAYGINIIWQNIPVNILEDSFRSFSPIDLIVGAGLVSLVFGALGLYIGIKRERKKSIYIFSSLMLGILFLLSFRLITLSSGLLFLGIGFALFSSITINYLYEFFEKSKLGTAKLLLTITIIILVIAFSLVPSYNIAKNTRGISEKKIQEMQWLAENTKEGTIVLGNVKEGNLISAAAMRKNVIDTDFLLAPSPVERLRDTKTLYTGLSEAKALEIIKKYNVGIIYLSEDTKKLYNINDLRYTKGSSCFTKEGNFYVVEC